ncbi:hypothetical protein N8J89_18885 [Crossiella sp. CA-258035]|uniref:hypothetical protein n=1 Tax=Crossiella sp. CA-258035 TaxID=2981138 RepID=UPI0024BCEF39|nr:hypothetical protein [Crossiella sp. CA-258035]WHT23056.1 hypothetical protein N8J89_18885 [Crossiella sp. CA-258035]
MAESDAVRTAAQLTRQLHLAAVVVTLGVLFGLQLPIVLAHQEFYRPVAGQYLALGVFAGVAVWVAVATWLDRPLGWWRWALVGVTLAASAVANATVLPEQYLGMPHWSYGTAGWPLTVLAMSRGIGPLAALLLAQYALTTAQLPAIGETSVTLGGTLLQTLITAVFQLAVGCAATILRRIAVVAAGISREEEELRTAETIRERVHADRKDRYAALATTTVPLLTGLAEGTADPAEPSVRRACAIEGARMRRLFAEGAVVADPLAHELHACIDLAERNGIAVQFAEQGERAPVPVAARRRLTEAAMVLLASARSTARVTVAGRDGAVTVSVLADAPEPDLPAAADGISTSVLRSPDRVWVETTWDPKA